MGSGGGTTTLPTRVVVAQSGGNYTTITAALAAINPSASTPYVIEIWPGVYTEPATVTLKSYIHLRGSGREVTTIKGSSSVGSAFYGRYLSNVTISGLTITGSNTGNGIQVEGSSSLTIMDNTISNNATGIDVFSVSPVLITRNNVTANLDVGIAIGGVGDWSATITDNNISGNTTTGNWYYLAGLSVGGCGTAGSIVVKGNLITGNHGSGIRHEGCNGTIADNVITGNFFYGAYLSATGALINNRIVNNSGTDIYLNQFSPAHRLVSNNVVDSISGSGGVGVYNSTSNGAPILVP